MSAWLQRCLTHLTLSTMGATWSISIYAFLLSLANKKSFCDCQLIGSTATADAQQRYASNRLTNLVNRMIFDVAICTVSYFQGVVAKGCIDDPYNWLPWRTDQGSELKATNIYEPVLKALHDIVSNRCNKQETTLSSSSNRRGSNLRIPQLRQGCLDQQPRNV